MFVLDVQILLVVVSMELFGGGKMGNSNLWVIRVYQEEVCLELVRFDVMSQKYEVRAGFYSKVSWIKPNVFKIFKLNKVQKVFSMRQFYNH